MREFLLGSFLAFLPPVFFFFLFLIAFTFYRKERYSATAYRPLVIAAVLFRFFYALILTGSQYLIWAGDPFTKSFLNSPLSQSLPITIIQRMPWLFGGRLGYFLFYSWGRFWLNAILSVGLSLLFWFFLKLLKKHRERFFREGETELGFLCALMAGWPYLVIFVPLTFVFVVLTSIFRRLILKEMYTTLGYSFLFAIFVTLLLGGKLLQIWNLGVLKI